MRILVTIVGQKNYELEGTRVPDTLFPAVSSIGENILCGFENSRSFLRLSRGSKESSSSMKRKRLHN